MALLSHKYHYIYMLNPRTASTATAHALRERTAARFIPKEDVLNEKGKVVVPRKHTTVKQLLDYGLISDEIYHSYYKFVTVRNPYDSIVSAWAKKTKDYAKLLEDKNSWVYKHGNYAEGIRRAIGSTFPEWVKMNYGEKAEAGKNVGMNKKYLKDADFVIRYEKLNEDFECIKEKLALPSDLSIPEVNITQGRSGEGYRSYYDDESVDIVSKVFKEEIDKLGYSF